ncbi:hypothetical protein EIP91_004438 [Steccherinum ochraceum]|uniref:DUF6593 domain-containing protein n=1 Tax=Steccherinum ochraceum TaxID=92696 RepID=A0A4R0RP88_9APHY|nr:hypothetical protein EIP91_004438 [Steccherinum ochraceum]
MSIGLLLWLCASHDDSTSRSLPDASAPLPERDAATTLTFSRDSLLHTTLLTRGTDNTVYVIDTNKTQDRTVIRRAYPGNEAAFSEVVRIERNTLSHDKITFQGFPARNVSAWLRRLSFSDPVPPSAEAPRYIWRATHAREIALYTQDDASEPIAWFRASSLSEPSPTLSLQPGAYHIQDAIVASLVVVEQRHRLHSPQGTIRVSRKPT